MSVSLKFNLNHASASLSASPFFGELSLLPTAPSSSPPPLCHDTFAVVARNDGESYHDHPLPALIL